VQHEHVERVKSILAAALAKPLGERDAFLDAVCAGDLALRRDVEQYFTSGDKTEQFVYRPTDNDSEDRPTLENVDPHIGKEVGKYTIKKRLAEGGMGIVYLATDKQLGREVALKILPGYFSMDKERLGRFHREARATSLLNHPNIVTVFELGQMDGSEFIVTEYVEGETLREKMKRGPIPFVEMIKIGSQIASALGAAHRAGIVHRDIKPENVMIRPDGYVKVLDFGLAKLSDAMGKRVSGGGSLHNRTVPGMIMGTAAYMSPEQAEGTDIDARTDIWAVGVLLYEMAAGKLPFEGPTASHTIVAILEHEPQEYEHPSAELRQIISTALQKDRQLRFQTADAMAESLDAAKHRLGYISDQRVSTPPIADAAPIRKVVAVKPRSSRMFLWLIPAVFALLVVGVLGIYGVIVVLRRSASVANSNVSAPEVVSPSPTPTVESVAATPEPAPTENDVYVQPTPAPAPSEDDRPGSEPRQRDNVRRNTVQGEPARTPVRTEPKPAPTKKPKTVQDPNCVFTNSCH
jgi:serine/threonine protein kinase